MIWVNSIDNNLGASAPTKPKRETTMLFDLSPYLSIEAFAAIWMTAMVAVLWFIDRSESK
jgi:hypothetical protein